MENKMEHEMETGIIKGFLKIRGTLLGVPIMRTIVFWGLCWGLPIQGNYRLELGVRCPSKGFVRGLWSRLRVQIDWKRKGRIKWKWDCLGF